MDKKVLSPEDGPAIAEALKELPELTHLLCARLLRGAKTVLGS